MVPPLAFDDSSSSMAFDNINLRLDWHNFGNANSDLLKYTIILIVFKLFPIYSMRNNMSVSYFDVYSGIYLYIIYIFILLVVINVFLHKNYDIMKILQRDVTNNTYDTGLSSNVYDTVYNDIILRIL
jgi:hypothetical protein